MLSNETGWGWGDRLGVWDGNAIKLKCDDCCTTINVIKFIELRKKTINAVEGMEKREPYHTVGRNVNWCNHCGKQYGDFLENQK